MEKINVMVNGLPGNVAKVITAAAVEDDRFTPLPFSLTGQDIEDNTCSVSGIKFELVKPDIRDEKIKQIRADYPFFIAIDYTHPTAVNSNTEFYSKNDIPFVMGTTGGDRQTLEEVVKKSPSPAVIAPNMFKQIVGFQAMLEFAATNFPGLFKGYEMRVSESHQNGKADTSGTARAVVASFNKMGVDFDEKDIEMIRDPEIQEKEWGIPKAYLTGHGWHTYTLTGPNGNSLFEFKHNINGREIYAPGTLDAVLFLKNKIEEKTQKKFYTMIDVLSGK